MNKSILLIAFDSYPSQAVSTQRTMAMFKYLNEMGYHTILLTAKANTYPYKSADNSFEVKENQYIYRASAFNIKEKLAVNGKYIGALATPDHFSPWIISSILLGKKIIKKHNIDFIWSTYPLPSAHVIASFLSITYKKIWLADYRDPAPYIHTTNGKWLDMIHKKIDNITFKNAKKIIFTTKESKKSYEKHFGVSSKFCVIENGYDESTYLKALKIFNSSPQKEKEEFTIYYSGSLYNNGRSPDKVFHAIHKLKQNNVISQMNFQLIFQGNINFDDYLEMITELGISDVIKFNPPVSHIHCIVEMLNSDLLLLIQGANFNIHVPTKIYEYIRSGKPIIIDSPSTSATAQLSNKFSQCNLVDGVDEIIEVITKKIRMKKTSHLTNISISNEINMAKEYSREYKAKQLDKIIKSIS
jgi:hypothetical protein